MQPHHSIMRSLRLAALGGLVLVSLVTLSCTTLGVRTEGVSGPLRWQATELHRDSIALEQRELYSFILALQETTGQAMTLHKLTARLQNSRGSLPVFWEQTGPWQLPAHGTLRIPLTSYRYCPYVHCHDLGALEPQWAISLVGTDGGGQPVHYDLTLRLPASPS